MAKRLSIILLWFGRILALLASVLFAALFIGEGAGEFTTLREVPTEFLIFLPLLFLAIVGLILSFFRRRAGAILMLAGGAAMAAFHLLRGGFRDLETACMFGVPYLVCGILSLIQPKESGQTKS